MHCSICLDHIESNHVIYTSKCEHTFHFNCIKKWLETDCTCPLCRNELFLKNTIFFKNNLINTDYKFINAIYKNDTVNFDNMIINDTGKQLINQCVKGWMHLKNDTVLFPLYLLKDANDKSLYIDYYLRQAILFFKDLNPNLIVKINFYDSTYYTYKNTYAEAYEIITEWIYKVMKILKGTENIIWPISMNSLIIDLITLNISKLNLKKSLWQTAIIAGIYNAINFFHNKQICKNNLIWLTGNSSKENILNEYIDFQNNIIKENIIKLY